MESLLNQLLNKYQDFDRTLLRQEGEYSSLVQRQQKLDQEIKSQKERIDVYEKALIVTQKLTELSRQETFDKIASIITTALQDIKDPTLTFKINYKLERNQPTTEFVVFNTKYKTEMDVMASCGGTIVDLVEFPLKVSLLLKWQPQLSRILVLDESFKHVAAVDRFALANFIHQLSERLGLQIILVSHSDELTAHAHRVFKVSHDGTKSNVTEEVQNEIH